MGGVGVDDEPPACVCAQQISPMHYNNNNTKTTKYQRSQLADRAEREAAERQRLAHAVLEEDESEFQARSNNWASFLQGKKGKRRKRDGGDG